MADRNLNIKLTAQEALSGAFAKAEAAVSSLNSRVRTTAESLNSFRLGALAVGGAIVGAGFAVYKFAQAAAEAEAIEARLNATLASTKGVAGMTKTAMMDLAAEMQRTTAFEGDTVVGAEALMLTFTKVNKDVFPTAIKLAADLSVAMGQDLNSSAIQIGKALNNPIQGLTALSRVGVSFTQVQKDQIEKFMETNQLAEAQKIILGELATEFGGQAAAQAATFTGRLSQVVNAYGDLKEELGFIITKNTFFIQGLDVLRQYLERSSQWVNNNQLALMNMAKNGIITVMETTGKAVEVLRFFHNGWLGIRTVANFVIIGVADGLRLLTETLALALIPFSKIIDGLVFMGAMDSNPLQGAIDAARSSIGQFQLSSRDAFSETFKDMEEVNNRYNRWGAWISEVTGKLRGLEVQQSKVNDTAGGGGAPGGDEGVDPAADKARAKAREAYLAMGAGPGVLERELSKIQFTEAENMQRRLENLQGFHTKKLGLMVEAGRTEAELVAANNFARLEQEQQMEQARQSLLNAKPEEVAAEKPQEFQEFDVFNKRLTLIQDFHTQRLNMLAQYGASEMQMNEAYNAAKVQQDDAASRLRLATASGTMGMMANMMQNVTTLTGKQGGAAFKAMKAFSIAQTLIKTYEGAVAARASLSVIPVVGPALGWAAFAAQMVSGLAQVKQISSMEPGGSASGTTISGGGVVNPSYSGGAPTAYPAPTRTEEKQKQDVTIIIQNGMGDAEYWRNMAENNIIPALNDAHDRDVVIKVRAV